MKVIETALPGVLIVEPKIFGDARGFFLETFQIDRYAANGIGQRFVQDNLSRSVKGTLRGRVLDVAVDVRVGSPTFGRHVAVELSEENRRQFWVPRGFAHGFMVLSDSADFFYKCDELYSPADEKVLCWNDPELGIDWGIKSPLVSPRDSEGRTLAQLSALLPRFEPA